MEKIIVQSRGSASPIQYLVGRDKLGAAWTWEQDRAIRMTSEKAKAELIRLKKEGWRLAEIRDYKDYASQPEYGGSLYLVNPINNRKFQMWFKAPLSIESDTKVLGGKAKLLSHRVECGVCEAVLLEGIKISLSGSRTKQYEGLFQAKSKVTIKVDKQEKILDIAVKDADEFSVAKNFIHPKTVFLAQEENGISHGCFLSSGSVVDVEIRGVPSHKGALMVNTNLFVAMYTTRETGTSVYDHLSHK